MGKFKSTSVSYHFDNPKKVYQIHIDGPKGTWKWLCSTKTQNDAQTVIGIVEQLLALPNGAQITKHLYANLS